jgi:hypothetical protein
MGSVPVVGTEATEDVAEVAVLEMELVADKSWDAKIEDVKSEGLALRHLVLIFMTLKGLQVGVKKSKIYYFEFEFLAAIDHPTPPPTAPIISTTTSATTSQKVVRRRPQINLCGWGYCCTLDTLSQVLVFVCGYPEVGCDVEVHTGSFSDETASSPDSYCGAAWGTTCADWLFCIARAKHREALHYDWQIGFEALVFLHEGEPLTILLSGSVMLSAPIR